MTNKFSTVSIAVLATFLASGAYAADINGGSKDGPSIFGETRDASRSGFYITGNLGIARGDRDASASISNSKHELGRLDAEGKFEQDDELLEGQIAGPVIFTDKLAGALSDDIDATVFGGEISYLYHLPNRRLAVEFGVGGTGYSDNETKAGFIGVPTVTGRGENFPSNLYPEVGEDNLYGTAGSVAFERDFDIDLLAKLHVFIGDRFSVYAGAGPSWARGKLKGGYASNYPYADGVFDNSIDETDFALGYAVVAGLNWWATDRIVVGAEYSYKKHSFEFDASKATDAVVAGDAYRYGSESSVDVDDEVHAIKAKIGFKLN